jgi:hypothetical protein
MEPFNALCRLKNGWSRNAQADQIELMLLAIGSVAPAAVATLVVLIH